MFMTETLIRYWLVPGVAVGGTDVDAVCGMTCGATTVIWTKLVRPNTVVKIDA